MDSERKVTILVIDDTDANRYTLSRILNRAGYGFLEASTGKEGMQLALQKPDLIILDVQLPDANGFELSTRLKEQPETRSIPVLMTSASFTQGHHKIFGLESGADGYLTTPIEPLELLATIKALLRMRETEHALRTLEERLRLMIESVKDYAIFSTDLQGKVSTWNTGAERVFGYNEAEILGQDFALLFTEEDREAGAHSQELQKAAETGKAIDERWHKRKCGERFFASGVVTPVFDASGVLISFTKVARDVTESMEAQEKLRKSQEIFRTMANSLPALVWMAGTDKLCYYFNKVWLDFTGRTLEQEMGNGWAEGIHPDDFERYLEIYNTHFDQRKPFEVHYRIKRHDGEYRWLLDRGEPHYDLDGSFAGYTGACIDIHDKLMAEQRLQQSEERFYLAVKGMNDGLWDCNYVTGETYYSPRYKGMLGYSDDEYDNRQDSWDEHIHPDDQEKASERIFRYLKGKLKEYKSFYRMRHKDGEYRWILARGIAVRDASGNVMRFVGAHTDMTEQKELERELRDAYQKAEAANTAKTDFLANMSHEIRTPMNAIIGLSNILSTTTLTDKQKEFLTTLQLSAESLLSLINDMLDIAKIEDNMIELERHEFSLPDLVEGVINMMSVKANEKGLNLQVQYDEHVGNRFIGDSLRVQQVLVNLLSNALKFTSHGSVKLEITLKKEPKLKKETKQRKTDDDAHIQKVKIKITDTGIGIPTDKLYSIFEKFTQGDSSITRKYGGSGLGLTISKALVERMGGNIHVASELNKGSVFTVNLPLHLVENEYSKSQAGNMEVNAPQTNFPEQKLILLVEDYKPNILVATTLLEDYGYRYEIAMSGKEALEKVMATPFNAILMDVQMHGMDGYETTGHIRKWEQEKTLPHTPIIAMTAHALTGDREKCLQAGMDDYISKPFNPAELQDKLQNLFKNT